MRPLNFFTGPNANGPPNGLKLSFAIASIRRTPLLLFCSYVVVVAGICALPVTRAIGLEHDETSIQSARDSKPVGEFRRDLAAFLKKSKVKDDADVRVGAIVDLCNLHAELVRDSRFKENRQLQGFRAVAAERLNKCRREVEIEIKRYERALAKEAKANRSRSDQQATLGALPRLPPSINRDHEVYSRWLVEDMQGLTEISGGPIRLWGYIGGNYGPVCDYGPDLVQLIETTINPDFWRSNGGNGILHYYQPLRILVVGASSQVHDDLGNLLQTLRTNGR